MPTAFTRHEIDVSRMAGGGGGGRSYSGGPSAQPVGMGVAHLYGSQLRVLSGGQGGRSPGVAPLYGSQLRVISGGQSSRGFVYRGTFDVRPQVRPSAPTAQGLAGGQNFGASVRGGAIYPATAPAFGARGMAGNSAWINPFPGISGGSNASLPPDTLGISLGFAFYYEDFVNPGWNRWIAVPYPFVGNSAAVSNFTNRGTQFGYVTIQDGNNFISDYIFLDRGRADGQWSASGFTLIGVDPSVASTQQTIPAGINPSPNPGPVQTIAQATARISSPAISPQRPAAPAPAPGTIPGTVAPAPAPAPTQAPGISPSVAPLAPATTPAPAPGRFPALAPAAQPGTRVNQNGRLTIPAPVPTSPPVSQPASSDPCMQAIRLLDQVRKRQEECCHPPGPPDCPTDIANIPIVSCQDGEPVYNYIPVPVPSGAGLLVEVVFGQLAESMASSCQGSPIFGDIGGGLGTLSQALGAIGASVGQVREKVEGQALSLAELLQKLNQLRNTIGVDEFPVTMPSSLLAYKDGQTSQLSNFAQWMAWYIRQFDAIAGQWPVEIEITDIDPATEGNQTRKISLPNISEALAEMYGLSVTGSVNADLSINFLMRLTAEILSIKTAGIVTQDHARAISEFLGYRGNPTKRQVPCNFDLNNLDSLEKILKESKAEIIGWKNDDKETVVGFLQRLMFSAGIIKQVFFRNADRLADLRDELTSMGSTEGDDQAWQEFLRFINDPQSAFNLRNTSDQTPRVKDIPPTNP